MLLCLGEPPRRFLWCCCSSFHFVVVSSFVDVLHFVVVLHSHFLFDVIPHPFLWLSPGFYTHFILSAQPIAEWFATLSFSTIPLSSYRERYGFEWAFFTHRRFLPYAPSRHFWHNLLLSRLPWEPAVIPWNLQGFILILKTQTRPICLFDLQ